MPSAIGWSSAERADAVGADAVLRQAEIFRSARIR